MNLFYQVFGCLHQSTTAHSSICSARPMRTEQSGARQSGFAAPSHSWFHNAVYPKPLDTPASSTHLLLIVPQPHCITAIYH